VKSSNKKIMDAVAVTGTNAYTSAVIPLDLMTGYSVVVTLTGTAVGDFKIEGSVDGVTFVSLENLSPSEINDAGSVGLDANDPNLGTFIWNVREVYYKSARVVYTNQTGSGTASASFFAKGM
jgi:hypothetical protein